MDGVEVPGVSEKGAWSRCLGTDGRWEKRVKGGQGLDCELLNINLRLWILFCRCWGAGKGF